MTSLVTLDDYERAARDKVSPAAWEYIHSGAADEHTLRWNREAFSKVRLAPRVGLDVSTIDMRVRLLGHDLEHPILLAPVAAHSLAHPDAEQGSAYGAKAAGAGMVLSSYTTLPVERVAATGVKPLWFQLYMQEREATRDLMAHVVKAGCTAIVVTIDTPTAGARDRQARASFDWPAGMPYKTVQPGNNPCTWKDVEWIRKSVKVPVIVKGVMRVDDAKLATQHGADAIIVSNHGARNLDTTPATIDVLPRIADALTGFPALLFDGGIRRGTDVLKALALGAKAVLLGRPYVYGLAVGGAAGVTAVLEILKKELAQAMALTGCPTVADLTDDVIWRA